MKPSNPTPLTSANLLNQKYLKLCQELGDAQFKYDQLTELIKNIKAKINLLNEVHPLLTELQSQEQSK